MNSQSSCKLLEIKTKKKYYFKKLKLNSSINGI